MMTFCLLLGSSLCLSQRQLHVSHCSIPSKISCWSGVPAHWWIYSGCLSHQGLEMSHSLIWWSNSNFTLLTSLLLGCSVSQGQCHSQQVTVTFRVLWNCPFVQRNFTGIFAISFLNQKTAELMFEVFVSCLPSLYVFHNVTSACSTQKLFVIGTY